MIRNLLKGSMPVFFIGGAFALCLFNIAFGPAVEHVVVERTSGMSMLFAFISGISGAWTVTSDPQSRSTLAVKVWVRALYGVLALLTCAAGVALTALSMSYQGVIEPFVTMFASILGIVFSVASGFVTIWALSCTSASKPEQSKDSSEKAGSDVATEVTPTTPHDQRVAAAA